MKSELVRIRTREPILCFLLVGIGFLPLLPLRILLRVLYCLILFDSFNTNSQSAIDRANYCLVFLVRLIMKALTLL